MGFLEDIKRRFVTQYGEAAHNAIAFAFNNEFSPVLQTQMEFYNNDPNADGLNKVKVQLDDVKNVMVENIEKVLERGEKIELLVDKTDRLNQQAFRFESSSRALRRAMWWKKMRCYAIIGGVALLVIYSASVSLCGFDYHHCKA